MDSPGEVKDCSRSQNRLIVQLAVEFGEETAVMAALLLNFFNFLKPGFFL